MSVIFKIKPLKNSKKLKNRLSKNNKGKEKFTDENSVLTTTVAKSGNMFCSKNKHA